MALSWLDQRFRRQTVSAIDGGFFAAFAPEEVRDALARLGPEYHEMLQINIADYLLSEAIYERDEESGRGIDWVLEAGPALRPEQREFLEALADAPLRLYEVVSVRHGEGRLTIVDGGLGGLGVWLNGHGFESRHGFGRGA